MSKNNSSRRNQKRRIKILDAALREACMVIFEDENFDDLITFEEVLSYFLELGRENVN